MIIAIISVVLIIIGIVFKKSSWYSLDDAGVLLLILGIAFCVCVGLVFLGSLWIGESQVIGYSQDKAMIDRVASIDNPTGEEVALAIKTAMEDNAIIMRTRYFIDNPWIGIFYYRPIAELKTFDIGSIRGSKAIIEIEVKE